MLSMEGISTEAKIGKILIFLAVVLGVIGMIVLVVFGTFGLAAIIPAWLVGGIIVLAIARIAGLVIGLIAFKSAEDGDYSRAGILGIIASVIPPVDLIMLAGGIVCLISPEAKKQ
jgi:hypothetical protein